MAILEVCCTDERSVMAAQDGGAQRVELCADIEADGLTPSDELIRMALATGIRVHVLVRPRAGNFIYNVREGDEIVDSIRRAVALGAHGVVVGALTAEGDVDVPLCQRCLETAGEASVTFHRAFDVCRDPLSAFDTIASLGFDRLLTSGHEAKAEQGVALIRQLVERSHALASAATSRLTVMPGSGVSSKNARSILEATGATEIHGTFRERVDGQLMTTAEEVRNTILQILKPN